jgi:hypothetical protein
MSRQLIESILSNNMLEANDMVEAKMAEIRERKMYEMKRMYQAEVFGGMTPAQIKSDLETGRKKRASEVLGLSPYDKGQEAKKKREKEAEASHKHKHEKSKPKLSWFPKIDMTKEKKIKEETLDEAGLGDAAKIAHDPSWGERNSFKKKILTKTFMKLRGVGRAERKGLDKKQEPETETKAAETKTKEKKVKVKKTDEKRPGMLKRLGKKIADHEPAPPGSAVVNAAKRLSDSPFVKQLSDIGFRNL